MVEGAAEGLRSSTWPRERQGQGGRGEAADGTTSREGKWQAGQWSKRVGRKAASRSECTSSMDRHWPASGQVLSIPRCTSVHI